MSCLALLLALAVGAPPSTATPARAAAPNEQSEKEADKAEQIARLELMKNSLKIYEFRAENDGQPMQLVAEPLLRWNNPVSGVRDGTVFIWTAGGRPSAAVQVFQLKDGLWLHEFQSLSGERFRGTLTGGEPTWSPSRAGIEMKPAPDGPAPAKSERQRLTQMADIAREYSAIDDFEDKKSRWELRLLSKPIYRYAAVGGGILDGALFAFAHGTDPEVFVLIEAVETAKGSEFRIGMAPMTAYAVDVSRKGKSVWSAPYRKPPFDPREPFFIREYHP
jgi:hypothetical protein